MKKIIKYFLYAVFSKKYHWYEIKFVYRKRKNGRISFDFKKQCGFTHKTALLNKREIKKTISPLHKHKDIKPYLCNGKMDCEITCYLGRFNKPL